MADRPVETRPRLRRIRRARQFHDRENTTLYRSDDPSPSNATTLAVTLAKAGLTTKVTKPLTLTK